MLTGLQCGFLLFSSFIRKTGLSSEILPADYKHSSLNCKIYPVCRHNKQTILSKDFLISMNKEYYKI